jgi:CheY-like chemotaxis protein
MLVEDDANDITLFQRALRSAGFATDVQVVEDGESAMQQLMALEETSMLESDAFPRMILLDLKMPRKSGLELLAWMRQRPLLRRLPVVIFTSSREPSDIIQAYELGANSYLVKPVSFDQLKEIVRTMHRYWYDWNERPEMH